MLLLRTVKNLLAANVVLKVLSLIGGFSVWVILGQMMVTSVWFSIPVSFYNIELISIVAPETILVHLAGKRMDLRALDTQQLALHLDGNQLKQGKNAIRINDENLFLPEHIKILHYKPSNLVVTVAKTP